MLLTSTSSADVYGIAKRSTPRWLVLTMALLLVSPLIFRQITFAISTDSRRRCACSCLLAYHLAARAVTDGLAAHDQPTFGNTMGMSDNTLAASLLLHQR